jgi:phosphatidylserine/phosphatidylglycerophosphate/cardiolipin synthase-like enzyme
MSHEHHQIGTAAARLADRLPHSVMISVATAVAQHGNLERAAARLAILQCLPTPDFRDATADFLDLWHSRAGCVGADAIAVALVTAARSEHDHRQEAAVEIVWTGPEPAGTRFRQTEQAILEVVNSATRRLTIVSYAVYSIPHIREALVRAAARGVKITIVVETPDRLETENEFNTIAALGAEVTACSSVYYWPKAHRTTDEWGKVGLLHVKCVVGDGNQLLLSSANFTNYAFNLNMELGVLITGGKAPAQIEGLFEQLIRDRILVKC